MLTGTEPVDVLKRLSTENHTFADRFLADKP